MNHFGETIFDNGGGTTMTEFEQRLDTLIMMLADPNITINPSGFTKIKENLLSSAKKGLWKDAQGDDLPPIDREVIVIDKQGKVCYGHRPDPKGWIGKPISYGKGGWNIPDVRWWLDLDLPNLEDLV